MAGATAMTIASRGYASDGVPEWSGGDDGRARVLVTWLSHDADDPATGALLARHGLSVQWAPKRGHRDPQEVARLASGTVGAIVSTDPFDASVFRATPGLRVISRVGVGVDSIDLEAATAAGVVVTVTPGCNEETVADHALAMILATLRRLVEHDQSIRRGEWDRAGVLTGRELHGMTVGVVGQGRIGRGVAKRLRGFGVRLLVCDPQVSRIPGAEVLGLEELLRRSELVTLHVPLQPSTRGMIGERELAQMRPGAILVNTSRGGLVDEQRLAEALHSHRLAAAALDVFEREPPTDSPLLKLPNVLLTPHVGGLSTASLRRMTAEATRNVIDALRGSPRPDVVANPDVLDDLPTRRRPVRLDARVPPAGQRRPRDG
jgi:phosphoglycerate dehydrogenase-like enzyme